MRRLEQIKLILEEEELDAILISSEENMHYLCQFSPSEGLVLATKDVAYHIVDSRYTVVATRYSADTGLVVKEITTSFIDTLLALLKQHKISTLGFEDERMTVRTWHGYEANLGVTLQPLGNKITALRSVKTKEELADMITAQRIAEKSYLELLNHIKVGKTEKELAALLDYLMLQNGSEGASFSTILISGKNTSMPHGVPSDQQILAGEFVTMDFGATYHGYHSDMTRTVAIGSCTEAMNSIYHTVLRAQEAAIACLGAGKKCKDIYEIAYKIIDENGNGKYFRHGLGHGVGLEIHEGLSISPKSETIFEVGNVTSIEPGIYLPDQYGVRIEDVLYIDTAGTINLTAVDKELLIL